MENANAPQSRRHVRTVDETVRALGREYRLGNMPGTMEPAWLAEKLEELKAALDRPVTIGDMESDGLGLAGFRDSHHTFFRSDLARLLTERGREVAGEGADNARAVLALCSSEDEEWREWRNKGLSRTCYWRATLTPEVAAAVREECERAITEALAVQEAVDAAREEARRS